MAVTHPSSMRTLIADTVTAQADVGSTFARLELQTATTTTGAILTFDSSAFQAASSGVATANTITDDTNAIGGTVTQGVIYSSTQNNEVLSCSVTSTGGGGDIELSSNVISSGQTVSITALTYTAPS